MTTTGSRHALVFGATGFIGRWLIVELSAQGVRTTAAVRSVESAESLNGWLLDHGVPTGVPWVLVDFEAEDLGLATDAPGLAGVTEIHNLAGAFRFGMSAEEGYQGNVLSARRIVLLAARLAGSPRLVHVSGYRVGSVGTSPASWTDEMRATEYSRLGAYEASKVEADGVVQATAAAAGVAFTIVNPSTVSGVSSTGESDQLIGLAASLRDLWAGTLTALPGNDETFLPVVTVDYLAKFMALVPTLPEADGQSFWVLDEDTPALPDLLESVGRHYQVRVPRLRIPVGLVKRLPSRVTKADPETLSFLSSDRYPTARALEVASGHALRHPETLPGIKRWADHLAAHRFGAVAPSGQLRTFSTYAGIHTFGIGEAGARTLVLPGLPVNADTWAETAAAMPEPTRVLDLPGLGMSSGHPEHWAAWLASVAGNRDGLHLVGHSIGAAVALEFAAANPELVGRLTLVAPAFLQPAPGLTRRLVPMIAAFFRFTSAQRLSRTLLGTDAFAPALASSAADLHRPGVARTVATLLARGPRKRSRQDLQRKLAAYPGDVHVVVGEHDNLSPELASGWAALGDRRRVTVVTGAGHYPQLTNSQELVDAISSGVSAAVPAG
jgi:nucleoside-diphosphate-sugar epimerase/pimeloyl-ACP methyl ester carboxylesterase